MDFSVITRHLMKKSRMKVKIKMKDRFLNAIIMGELGTKDSAGFVVTLCEFKQYFRSEIKSSYIETFLPSVVIERGCSSITPVRYLNKVRRGVYHVGFDVVEEQIQKNVLNEQKQADSGVSQLRSEQALNVHKVEKHPDAGF